MLISILVTVLILVIVFGLLFWLANNVIPMDATARRIVNVVLAIVLCIILVYWLLGFSGAATHPHYLWG